MRAELGAAFGVRASAADLVRRLVWLIEGDGPALVSVDVESGARTHRRVLPDHACALALTADGTGVVAGCGDGAIWWFDAARPEVPGRCLYEAGRPIVDLATTSPARGPG